VLCIIINMSILESILIIVMCEVNDWVIKGKLKRHQVVPTENRPISCVCSEFKLKNKILRIVFCCTVQSKSLILKSFDLCVVCLTSHVVARTIIKILLAT